MESNVSVEPGASVEGAVASVKEVTAIDATEIQSEQTKELQSAQSTKEHFQWLKDAAQVVIITGMLALPPISYNHRSRLLSTPFLQVHPVSH